VIRERQAGNSLPFFMAGFTALNSAWIGEEPANLQRSKTIDKA
jgi:hypothetical protein